MRAVIALGDIGSDQAIAVLLQTFQDQQDAIGDWYARQILIEIGSEQVIEGLLQISRQFPNLRAREKAVSALDDINWQVWPKITKNASLRTATSDEMRCDQTVKKLLQELHGCAESYKRRDLVEKLGDVGSKMAIPALLKLVEDADPIVCGKAAEGLGKIEKQHTNALAPHLPHLLTLIPTASGEAAYRAILAIQTNCKYYNYKIFRSLPAPLQPTQVSPASGRTIN